MGFSSRQWAAIISRMASRIYFFIIILQIPLFRFPCGIGVCESPIEVTASQLIASAVFPEAVVKVLLYPNAIIDSFVKGKSIPSHDQLIKDYRSNMRKANSWTGLKQLEVLAGSYLCVAGALYGLIKPGRMSLSGLLLIVWGISRQTRKNAADFRGTARIHPEMVFAIIVSFFSMKRDVRRLIRCFKPKRAVKRPKNHLKTK